MSEHDHHPDHHHHEHHHVHADGTACSCEEHEPRLAGTTAIDPVCGMTVENEGAEHHATYEGQTYYFCSGGCRSTFMSNPGKYVSA